MNAIHPGALIRRRFVEPMELTTQAVADAAGVSCASISRILNEKAAISAEMSVRLGFVFGVSDDLFANIQCAYDIAVAREDIALGAVVCLRREKHFVRKQRKALSR